MLINKKITVSFIIFLAVVFLLPDTAQAQDALGINNQFGNEVVNLGTKNLRETIGGIVNIFLGFLGILATLIIIYGGFVWMTSRGNAERVDRAKRILINGFIGLLIILSSYAISRFILQSGFDAAFGPGGSGPGGGPGPGGVGLGGGALESVYPAPNAVDVPRNTNIYATFKEPIDIAFIVDSVSANCVDNSPTPGLRTCDSHPSFVRLYSQGNITNPITDDQLRVTFDMDPTNQKTFKFDPQSDLGSNSVTIRYTMDFGDILTQNGEQAFRGGSYAWYFITSTELDNIPPSIVSVFPVENTDAVPNTIVQINFSEAVNPYFVTGDATRAELELSLTEGGNLITGYYHVSNQYRTIEFVSDTPCGINTCGEEVFCLPASSVIDAFAGAAIEDAAGNQMGTDRTWSFNTLAVMDLDPPTISNMQNSGNVDLDLPVEVQFNERLSGTSINSSNIDFFGPTPINYYMTLESRAGLDFNTIVINHDRFEPFSYYYPTFTSGIRDSAQNCWYYCACDDTTGSTCVCDNNDPTPPPGLGDDCPGSDCVGEDF